MIQSHWAKPSVPMKGPYRVQWEGTWWGPFWYAGGMGKWVHRLTVVDLEAKTVICTNCGVVPLSWNNNRPRCSVAKEIYRQSPGRHKSVPYERKKKRGLTPSETRKRKAEDKVCKLCRSPNDLMLDHCHKSKKIRDTLCRTCNTGLGMFKDDPALLRAAADYIESHAPTPIR